MDFRPFSDWIVVKLDQHQKKSELLELPTNESAVRLGTVVRTGPGRPLEGMQGHAPMGVEPGEKVAFLRWHSEHRPGKAAAASLEAISHELGAEVVLIRQADILFAYTDTVRVDI